MNELESPATPYETNNKDVVAGLAERLATSDLAELRAAETELATEWQEEGYVMPRTYLYPDGTPVVVAERYSVASDYPTDPVDINWRVRFAGQTIDAVVPPTFQDAAYWRLHGERNKEVIYDVPSEDESVLSPDLQQLVDLFGARLAEREIAIGGMDSCRVLEVSSRPIGYSLGDIEREVARRSRSSEKAHVAESTVAQSSKFGGHLFKLPFLRRRAPDDKKDEQ